MAQIIGYVKSVEGGSFFVKDAKGHIRQLKEGEAIHNGELVYGASNNIQSAQIIVDVTLKGAGDIVIGGNGALAFDTSLLEGIFTHHDAVVYVNSVHDAVAAIAPKEAPAASADNGETTAGETAAGDTVTNTETPTDTFAARTGAVADVSTGLSSVVNGGVSATFNGTNTPDVNDQPVVANVAGIVNEALDGLNIISGQLLASDADITDTQTFFAVDSSLLVNGIPAAGVTFTLNPDGTYQVSGDFNRLAVGENATVSFQYYAVDNGLPIGAPHASLPATVTITVMGTNDQPVVSDINVNTNGKEQVVKDALPGDTYQTIVFESHDATDAIGEDDTKEDITTTFGGSLATVMDDDVSDTHTYRLVEESARVSSENVRGLGVTVDPSTGDYTVSGNFNALAAGETATVTFRYVADDGRGFDGTDGINEKSLSEPKTVTLTITGTNDQPVVSDVVVAEPIVEVLEGSNLNLLRGLATATDDDLSDTHKYYGVTDGEMVIIKVIEAPKNVIIDPRVWVNTDGTYSVKGDFNALAEGEKAIISFQYYAVDSSVTQLNGESNTSELKTVTLTVTGTNDQPIVSDVTTTATETNGTQTFSGQLALTTDLDTTDTHTFQQTGTASVMASNEVVSVTDFSVAVAANGTYTVNGNFDHLAAGETATVTFQYTVTDDSGTSNAISAPKTVTLTVTGTNDQPIVSDVNVNGTGEVVGLDTLNDSGYSLLLAPQEQLFTALENNLNQIDLNFTASSVGTFNIQIVDAIGHVVYTSDVINVLGGGENIISAPISAVLTPGENYRIQFTNITGSLNAELTNPAQPVDGLGLIWHNYLYDHQDMKIKLTYGSGAIVILETNGVETIHEGKLVLTTDLDTTDTHTYQLVDK
ncbi:MAG: VCBS domain-containing protein, partial [Sulfuricurvum sp.]